MQIIQILMNYLIFKIISLHQELKGGHMKDGQVGVLIQ